MASKATASNLLEQRIAENTAAQEIDLGTWIFERLHLAPDSRVLELCCGTGGQTVKFVQFLDDAGSIVALDVSRSALDTLASKVSGAAKKKLLLAEANLNNFKDGLAKAAIPASGFDLVFCAYGLYYSADARQTLAQARACLNPGGRIAVVGPFGPNNKPLFDMVRQSGAVLSDAVLDSSERFMLQTVLPWGAENFERMQVHTMVNRVRWASPERVLNYWENTTFYDPAKRPAFESLVRAHFEKHGQFVNEKWVMLAEMSDARA